MIEEKLKLTDKWDKTFIKSDLVNHRKITFNNRYGITLAADLYEPKNCDGKLAAIAVCGPFGAVKEQASGLYAMELAKRGFLTIAFDPSFTGESGGVVRNMASPDINTEDFQAAVDYLATNDRVDKEKIGILGICGWGGLALNTAIIDTRVKATVVSTMYDMSRIATKGYFDNDDSEEKRYNQRKMLNEQRTIDYKSNDYKRAGGVVDPLPSDAVSFVKDYYDYYKTARGYHIRSLNSNAGWNVIGTMSYLNQPILTYSNEIRSAVLIIHGEKAHSFYMGKTSYENMIKDNKYIENKHFLAIKNAVHTDLYDDLNVIPFSEIEKFYKENLK